MKKWFLIMGMGLLMGCANNEVLKITEDTPIPIKTMKGDSYIFLDDIKHESTSKYMVYSNEDKKIKILLETHKNDVEEANLVINGKKIKMNSIGYKGNNEVFGIDIEGNLEDALSYHFEVKDQKFNYYYGKKSSYDESEVGDFNYIIKKVESKIPDWSRGIEWYSVYIDRFRDGNQDNSPIYSEYGPSYYFRSLDRLSDGTLKSDLIDSKKWQQKGTLESFEITKWGSNWNKVSYPEREANQRYFPNYIKNSRRYGGDLQGVIEKVNYLKELGVEGINLSPVFYSASGSKLDTIDFGHISPDYAITNKNSYKELNSGLSSDVWTSSDLLFQKTIDEAHSRGMKVVQEINFEYVSTEFLPYQDYLKNKEKSQYKDWFLINENNLKTSREESIVRLNLENISLQDYLIRKTSKWVKGNNKSGIDGYFVKNSIDSGEFLKRWKKALRSINKEFLLVGESTKINTKEKGIDGFDILANYDLGSLMEDMFRNTTPTHIEEIKNQLKLYSFESNNWNLLESYDTNRFYSSLVNSNKEFDILNSYSQNDYINIRPDLIDKGAIKKLKLAVLVQLTIDSSPLIYYGSEKGMWGADAPESRKPMIWDDIAFEKETDSLVNYHENKTKVANAFRTDEIKDDISYDVKSEAQKNLQEWYKQISEFRSFDKELFKGGSFKLLDKSFDESLKGKSYEEKNNKDSIISYERKLGNRSAIIVINISGSEVKTKIPVEGDKGYTDFYTSERYNIKENSLKIGLKPYGYLVLYRKIEKNQE